MADKEISELTAAGAITGAELLHLVQGGNSRRATAFNLLNAAQPFTDVASATTTDIGAVNSLNVRITGTVTITGLGTAAAGVVRRALFAASLTLTQNATSLILLGGEDITTAAGDVGEFVSLGSGNWRMVAYSKADGTPLVGGISYALIRDQKATGTAGGTATAGAWRTRDINTVVFDPDGIVSIDSNQFTLGAGKYIIRGGATTGSLTNQSKARIRNITAGSTVFIGQNTGMGNPATFEVTVHVPFSGIIDIASSSAFELQMWNTATYSPAGYGRAGNFDSQPEVYSQIEIIKIG